MATIKPFAALRPRPDLAARICELPYDTLSSAEARALAGGNPLSFFHVSKPEIDLPVGVDPYAPAVYAKGRENFSNLITQGALRQDREPAFYLYRQVMGRHAQVGLVATASCEEYLVGLIKKHELTRPDKEDDRVRHVEALNAQTGPAFLAYRAAPALDELVAEKTAGAPDVDFTAHDGVRHTAWTIADAPMIQRFQAEFERVPSLYVADGHHRTAAAARICQKRHGTGGSANFLAVIFPHNQLQILPYHRVLKDLNGLTPEALLQKLGTVAAMRANGAPQPPRPREIGLYLGGRWHALEFRETISGATDRGENLDVTLLQNLILGPFFDIADPRTSQRIHFVGGIRGPAELERLVNSGEYACAFSLHPTSMEDLMAIADAGGLMPPKSTWFEPKLRDAMFCHRLGPGT